MCKNALAGNRKLNKKRHVISQLSVLEMMNHGRRYVSYTIIYYMFTTERHKTHVEPFALPARFRQRRNFVWSATVKCYIESYE